MPFIEQSKPVGGDPTRKEDIDTLIDNSTFLNNNIAASVGGLIINWSFETDADSDGEADGWTYTNYTGGSNALEQSNETAGVNSQSFTSTVLANGGGYIDSLDYFEVIGNDYYNWSLWVSASVANVSSRYQVTWYDDTKTSISTTTLYTDSDTSTSSFKKYSSILSPATARYAKVRVEGGIPATGSATGVIYFDAVYFGLNVGSIVELGRDEFTASTTIVEYSWPATTFDMIILDFTMRISANNTYSDLLLSTDAGSSYISTGYNSVYTPGTTTRLSLSSDRYVFSPVSSVSGRIIINNVSNAVDKVVISNIVGETNTATPVMTHDVGGGTVATTSEITGLQFTGRSPSFHPGIFVCRGIRRND